MKMLVATLLLCISVVNLQANEEIETVTESQGATWAEGSQGATWNTQGEPVFYLFPPYHGQGNWVETPAKVAGAIGVIPGTLVGCVLGVPLMPFTDFEKTVHASNTFFGQGFSMILGSPFYATKLIFWDVPKAWFE